MFELGFYFTRVCSVLSLHHGLLFFPFHVDQLLRKEEQLSQHELQLQQKEAEAQSAKRSLSEARGKLRTLEQQHEESCRLNSELEIER